MSIHQLFQILSNEQKSKNVLFSPLSLNLALAAVQQGCVEDSIHFRELCDFLGVKNKEEATCLWKQMCDYTKEIQSDDSPLKMGQFILWDTTQADIPLPKFKEDLKVLDWVILPKDNREEKEMIKETEENEDSMIVQPKKKLCREKDKNQEKSENSQEWIKDLNKKISNLTQGNISQLIDPLSITDFSIILANALFVNLTWKTRFNSSSTCKKAFFSPHLEKEIMVDMMQKAGMTADFSEGELGTLVELSYKESSKFRLGLLLPSTHVDSSSTSSTSTSSTSSTSISSWQDFVETKFSLSLLEKQISSLKSKVLDISVPKFKHQQRFDDIKHSLKKAGLKEFTSSTLAFDRASVKKNLFIDKIIHQVSFKTDESGTVASAATAVVVAKCALLSNRIKIDFNRPFLYYLRDADQPLQPCGLLFLGTFVSPQ